MALASSMWRKTIIKKAKTRCFFSEYSPEGRKSVEILDSRRADRHGYTLPSFYSVLCIMTPNRDLRVLAYSFFQLWPHLKALWFTSHPWWLIKSHFFWSWLMLEEAMGKVLPALPRGHAQFKPGTDCLSLQDCNVNTFFSFLLKFQRVWGLLLYFLTGFFILWSGRKRQSLN